MAPHKCARTPGPSMRCGRQESSRFSRNMNIRRVLRACSDAFVSCGHYRSSASRKIKTKMVRISKDTMERGHWRVPSEALRSLLLERASPAVSVIYVSLAVDEPANVTPVLVFSAEIVPAQWYYHNEVEEQYQAEKEAKANHEIRMSR